MPWFRPTRTLIDARGATWEIYVTRTRIGQWKGVDTPDVDPTFDRGGYTWWLLVPVFVLIELIVGLLRLIALVPLSLASAASRQGLQIEAIVERPWREVHAWSVQRATLDGVLDEICAGLERGAIARPSDARYLGERE
jgi:hypothetical protein